MKNPKAAALEHERACARVTARFAERWLRIYVALKLRNDPIYPVAYALLRDSAEPLVDVGCGVGLLAFYLRERNFRQAITGIDRDGRKIGRANAVARDGYSEVDFLEHDVSKPFEQRGNIVLFDLLHYLRPNEQLRILERLAAGVAPGGILLIRDCPRDGNARFWLTHWAERFAQTTTWNVQSPLHFPTRADIFAAFPGDEFTSEVEPLSGCLPFNNHLFIFRRRVVATVPARARRSDNFPSRAPSG
jgi:SAM-dependent methyltransferase